jgi:hypothetical protein
LKDGLKVVNTGINKLWNSIKHINSSPARNQVVSKCYIKSNKQPAADFSALWNLTFLMIESGLWVTCLHILPHSKQVVLVGHYVWLSWSAP